MPSPNDVPIDPTLLETYSLVQTKSESWKDVQVARGRLAKLREDEQPYENMEQDRDVVLAYAAVLQRCTDTIGLGLCLATHLSRSSNSKSAAERFADGLRALSSGLGLAPLDSDVRKAELQRCLKAVSTNLTINLPTITAKPTDSDFQQWRVSLESALESIRGLDSPDLMQAEQNAWRLWQDRLLAFAARQPEIPPDIDYLRCLASKSPAGVILPARLAQVNLNQWSELYCSTIAANSSSPLWLIPGILGAVGFDIGRDLESTIRSTAISPGDSALDFLARSRTGESKGESRKGLIVVRLAANSVTAPWMIAPTVPALTMQPSDVHGQKHIDLWPYFQPRLHGVLIEVDPAETVADAQKRVSVDQILKLLPSVRLGLLLKTAPPSTSFVPSGYVYATSPSGLLEAAKPFTVSSP
jgi:hypothetical protein